MMVQVVPSKDTMYGYVLLFLFMLPYFVMMLVLTCISMHWGFESCPHPFWLHKVAYSIYGLALTPTIFVILEVSILLSSMSIQIPDWLQVHLPDVPSYYRLNGAVDSVLCHKLSDYLWHKQSCVSWETHLEEPISISIPGFFLEL